MATSVRQNKKRTFYERQKIEGRVYFGSLSVFSQNIHFHVYSDFYACAEMVQKSEMETIFII